MVALLALAPPLSPGAESAAKPAVQPAGQPAAQPVLAPRHVLDAIAAALERDDLAAAKAAIDPASPRFPTIRRPQPRGRPRRPARRIDGGRGSLRRGDPPGAAIAGRLRQPRAPAPGARRRRSFGTAGRARGLCAAAGHRSAAARGAVPDRAAAGPRRPLRRGDTGDRSPARGGARASAGARGAGGRARGSGDADGARTAVAALAAHPQLAREDIDAVLPRWPDCPAARPRTEQALLELLDRRGWSTPATLRRLAAIESAGGRYARGAGLAREGRGARRARRGAADRARPRGVQGRRRQGRARLSGARARSGADQRAPCTSCSASSASS